MRNARPLNDRDLDKVIGIDARHAGRPRRRFFEKRFAAAARRPADYVHLGIDEDGRLAGFALVRVQRGEFGGDEPVAALDVIGIDPDRSARGLGRSLLDGIADAMRQAGIRTLRSETEWTDTGLMNFFEASGFELASRMILERRTAVPFHESADD